MVEKDLTRLSSAELVKALIKDNSLASEFDRLYLWDEIDPWGWCNLLSAQPQFADKCPDKMYYQFSQEQWRELLKAQPQFADKCTKYYGWDKFEDWIWSSLLSVLPQFWIYCPKESVNKIKKDPTKANECKCWDRFKPSDWLILLESQPQFADKCTKYKCWGKFYSGDWYELLKAQPQFIEKAKEYPFSWPGLLQIKPELANECEWWETTFDPWGWSNLLKSQPQLWVYSPQESVKKIKEDPNKAEECKCWDRIDSENWSHLLSSQPQFANKCNWSKMRANNYDEYDEDEDGDFDDWEEECGEDYSEDWKNLLLEHPRLAEYFTDTLWDGFSQKQWAKLESKYPEIFKDKHMLSTLRKLAK